MSEEQSANFKLWWDEEHHLTRFQLFGSGLTAEDANQLKQQVLAIYERHPKCNWLVDIGDTQEYPSPQVRVVLSDLALCSSSCSICPALLTTPAAIQNSKLVGSWLVACCA